MEINNWKCGLTEYKIINEAGEYRQIIRTKSDEYVHENTKKFVEKLAKDGLERYKKFQKSKRQRG